MGHLDHTPFPTRLRDHLRIGARKTIRARGWEGMEQNPVFWTWQDDCTHELTEAVVAYTRFAQDQKIKPLHILAVEYTTDR